MRPHSPKRQQSTRDLKAVRPLIAERSQGACEHCGQTLPINAKGEPVFELHHRLRRTQGGTDCPSNLLAVLSSHHTLWPKSIHQEPAWSVENGWIVERGKDPARVPVMILGRDWLLRPDGTKVPADGCVSCGSGDCGLERCAVMADD